MTQDVTQEMVELYCLGVLSLERQWQVEAAFDTCPQVQEWFVALGELPDHVQDSPDAPRDLSAIGKAFPSGGSARTSAHATIVPQSAVRSAEPGEAEMGRLLTELLQARQTRRGRANVLRNVTVVRGWRRSACRFMDKDQEKWDKRIAAFGREVAPHLARLLEQSRIVGLTLGHTIAAAITYLKQFLDVNPFTHGEVVEFVATVGGDVNHPHVRRESNSSILATELSKTVNGSWRQAYTLHGIPSFLSDVHGPDLEVVRSYIAARPCVQRVLERANDLDMLVTSCGRADQALAFWNDELGPLGMVFNELKRLTECEIGGVLVPKADLNARDQEQVDEMRRRWTGITLEHYRKCARSSGPGVVLLALDKSKAAYVLNCVDQGLVNELLVDRDLGEQLESLLASDAQDAPANSLRAAPLSPR